MANLIDLLSDTTQEYFGAIQPALERVDSLWTDIKSSSLNVSKDSRVSKGWNVYKRYSEGATGSFHWEGTAGPSIPSSQPTHTQIMGQPSVWPSSDESALPGYFDVTIPLARAKGLIPLPMEFLEADQLARDLGGFVEDILRGHQLLIAKRQAACFYGNTTDKRAMSKVGGNVTVSGATCSFSPIGGQANLFCNGMHVDIYRNISGTYTKLNGNKYVIVDGIRLLPDTTNDAGGYGLVTLYVQDATNFLDMLHTVDPTIDTLAADDLIIPAGSWDSTNTRSYGTSGPETWMINTGSIYGVNVATYPQFMSLVVDLNDTLTEEALNQYFGRAKKAWGSENLPDTMIMSGGAINAYVENRTFATGLFNINRNQGSKFQFGEGFYLGNEPYSFDGMPVRFRQSESMPSDTDVTQLGTSRGGHVWGLKMRDNNIERFVPPSTPGAKKASRFGGEIQFLFGNFGPMGIFVSTQNSSGQISSMLQAPYWMTVEYAPKWIPGMLFTSVTEVL